MSVDRVDGATLLSAAMDGAEQRVGRLTLHVDRGPARLQWTMPTGLASDAEREFDRGEIRFVAEMPVHARPKIALLVSVLIAVGVSVLVALVVMGAKGNELPISMISFLACLPAFAAIIIGIQLLRVRERVEIDSRTLLSSDEPFDFVVCRKHVAGLVELSQPRNIITRWASVRVALQPSGASEAEPLPLCGSGLTDVELRCLLEAGNAFMDEAPADGAFECAELEAHPGVVTLTALRDLR